MGNGSNKRILVVDDEKDIQRLIEIYLKNEGFEVMVASNGIEAVSIVEKNVIDLIVLDIMMPIMDGVEACLKIREISHVPIIFLSAKSEDVDKILGLSSGADDYLTKPFNPLELIARIKAQFRREEMLLGNGSNSSDKIRINGLLIDSVGREVLMNEKAIKLTPTEFEILLFLAENKNRVMSIKAIYEHVWNEVYYEDKNTVMVHIRKIREKLACGDKDQEVIKTVWGVGYKIDG